MRTFPLSFESLMKTTCPSLTHEWLKHCACLLLITLVNLMKIHVNQNKGHGLLLERELSAKKIEKKTFQTLRKNVENITPTSDPLLGKWNGSNRNTVRNKRFVLHAAFKSRCQRLYPFPGCISHCHLKKTLVSVIVNTGPDVIFCSSYLITHASRLFSKQDIL